MLEVPLRVGGGGVGVPGIYGQESNSACHVLLHLTFAM